MFKGYTKITSAVAIISLAASSIGLSSSAALAAPPANPEASTTSPVGSKHFSSEEEFMKSEEYKEIETAFGQLSQMSDEEVKRAAKGAKCEETGAAPGSGATTQGIPVPGPAAIIGCVLTAGWVFKDGANENNILDKLTEVVVGCVGIPGASALIAGPVKRIIWQNRDKIIAGLSSIGLTAAQLAPLKNAPEPR